MSKWSRSQVLLPGLLMGHAVLSAAVVVFGRSGFERTLGSSGARLVGVALALGAIVGLGLQIWRTRSALERCAVGLALGLPLTWLWVIAAGLDYDAIAGVMSATAFGDRGDVIWFPGVPFVALGYTLVLFTYVRVCVDRTSNVIEARFEPAVRWLIWLLCGVSFAGVVHWATGW